MGPAAKLASPMRREALTAEPYRARCADCGDSGYIGNLQAVGGRLGLTYVELTDAVREHHLAFCGCASGDFQRQFLQKMNQDSARSARESRALPGRIDSLMGGLVEVSTYVHRFATGEVIKAMLKEKL